MMAMARTVTRIIRTIRITLAPIKTTPIANRATEKDHITKTMNIMKKTSIAKMMSIMMTNTVIPRNLWTVDFLTETVA